MKYVNLSICVGVSLLGFFPLICFTLQAATMKDSSSALIRPLAIRAESNFSLSPTFMNGKEYCQNEIGAKLNCFPFQNVSSNSYMNITFEGTIQAVPMFQRKGVKLNYYTVATHVTVFNPVQSKTIYDGNLYDMVGLFCDSDRCTPWN
ncbi:MAG: hypothetical protein ACPGUD_09930 [Parashewanella sp.]